MSQKFRRIEKVRTFDSVLAELRSALEDGRLRPGEKLPSEPDLAAELGVSRSLLREARKALELSGYLHVRRGYGGGTFVAETKPDEFQPIPRPFVATDGVSVSHLADVRMAIEPVAARIAAERLLLPQRVDLDEIAGISLDDERPAKVLAADAEFHVAVARASGNPVFVALLESLRPITFRALRTSVFDPRWRRESQLAHEQIVQRICAGDGSGAAAAMREHLAQETRP
jgi:GntR family transcriptional regulator, transcriptional repressor for pyruvate dehydrogenase complex